MTSRRGPQDLNFYCPQEDTPGPRARYQSRPPIRPVSKGFSGEANPNSGVRAALILTILASTYVFLVFMMLILNKLGVL